MILAGPHDKGGCRRAKTNEQKVQEASEKRLRICEVNMWDIKYKTWLTRKADLGNFVYRCVEVKCNPLVEFGFYELIYCELVCAFHLKNQTM